MNTQSCPSQDEYYKMPPASPFPTRESGNFDMINDFLERELQDWMETSDQYTLMESSLKKANHPLTSYEEDFSDPYPLTFDTSLKGELDRDADLKTVLDSAHTVTDEESSGDDQSQGNVKVPVPCESMKMDKSGKALKGEPLRQFREFQDQQWYEIYRTGLLEYIKKHGHCCVPNNLDENPRLGRWVKRQRYQYKLLQQGKQSTLTDSRVQALEEVGFVWDSHAALWVERLNELKAFRKVHGHCNVPSTYPENVQLSTWVKCQRRQYKLYTSDEKISNLTADRIAALETLGFEWDGRVVRSNSRQFRKMSS